MAAKKTNRTTRSRKPKTKKAKAPSFKHAIVIKMNDDGIGSIHCTVPGMKVVALFDADEFTDEPVQFGDTTYDREVFMAERCTRGYVNRHLGPGDPTPNPMNVCAVRGCTNDKADDAEVCADHLDD